MAQHLLPTTIVGSYPQPDWLVNRDMLSKSVPSPSTRKSRSLATRAAG